MENIFKDIILSTPILTLILFSFIPLFLKAVFNTYLRPLWSVINAILALSLSFTLCCYFILEPPTYIFSKLLSLDLFTWIGFLVIIFISLITLPLFLTKSKDCVVEKFFSEYMFLFLNSVAGLMLIISSNHLLTTFIAIEHISLCFYLMIPMARESSTSIESSIKYFILGSVAGCILLLGLAFIMMTTGSGDFFTILSQTEFLIEKSRMFAVGLGLILIGLLFKLAIFPFQFWAPDVYQGGATPLVSFMSTAVKTGMFFLLTKFILLLGWNTADNHYFMLSTFQWVVILSLGVGHISALFQGNLKRLLIYSSIAHAGYMFMALLLPNTFSAASLVYYLITYSIFNAGAFSVLMLFEEGINGCSLARLKGLSKTHPILAILFSWFLINLAGLPLSAGFFAKLFIFKDLAFKDLNWVLLWATLGSALALYYYLKPIVYMFGEPENTSKQPENLLLVKSLIVCLALVGIFLTIGSGWIHSMLIQS